MKNIRFNIILTTLALILLTGCTGIGPRTIARDRFNYVEAISNSWKKQTLLNLVKIRYVDNPVFLDVSSIISQYAIETDIKLSATWSDVNNQSLGGSGKYTDRPTITYTLLTGDKFSRSLMRPLPIQSLLFLIDAGYPVDFMFRIGVQTINGIHNRFGGEMVERSADPKFHLLLEKLRRIQSLGGLGVRAKALGEKNAVTLFFRTRHTDKIVKDRESIRQILGLNMDANEFSVVYGSFANDDREIAILSRSMLHIMMELASFIDVPAKDVDEGRVFAPSDETGSDAHQLIRIQSSASSPEQAFVAVRYRDNWFWIDDRDFASKRVFSFLMLLFSLTETGDKTGAPIITVPTR